MTTDQELRDLLTAAADLPARPSGWDDVVRRGRHHRRRNRIRTGLAAGGVAVLAAIGAAAVVDQRGKDTGVVADDPDGSATTTTLARLGPLGPRTDARVSGVFLTVLIDPADPTTDFDPCSSERPKVTETPTAVVVEIVDAADASADSWAACQSSAFSGWATVELTDPLGVRPLYGSTGDGAPEIPVLDNADLLFPTVLPAPFDLTRWDESGGETGLVDRTFSWSAADLHLSVRNAPLEGTVALGANPGDGCTDGQATAVRGHDALLCTAEDGGGFGLLWDEGGYRRQIELGPVSGNTSPFTLEDLLAVAEGLEPLG